MDEKKLQAFIQWLPTKFEEFQNKTPDEIAKSLNDLYNKGEKGKVTLQNMWKTFEQESSGGEPGMFKEGGKLDFLVQKYAKGGKTARKCACGCELIMKKAKGGIIEECACGCKMHKEKAKQVESYQEGNKLNTVTGATKPVPYSRSYRQGDSRWISTNENSANRPTNTNIRQTVENQQGDRLIRTISPNLQDTTYTVRPLAGNWNGENFYDNRTDQTVKNNSALGWFQGLFQSENRPALNRFADIFNKAANKPVAPTPLNTIKK